MIYSSKLTEHDPHEGGVDEETQAVYDEIQHFIFFGSFQEYLTFHFRIIIKLEFRPRFIGYILYLVP
jgi:hypothetical protein